MVTIQMSSLQTSHQVIESYDFIFNMSDIPAPVHIMATQFDDALSFDVDLEQDVDVNLVIQPATAFNCGMTSNFLDGQLNVFWWLS